MNPLARRNGLGISHTNFNSDLERLTKALAFVEEARRNHDEAQVASQSEGRREGKVIVKLSKPRSHWANRRLIAVAAGLAIVAAGGLLIKLNLLPVPPLSVNDGSLVKECDRLQRVRTTKPGLPA